MQVGPIYSQRSLNTDEGGTGTRVSPQIGQTTTQLMVTVSTHIHYEELKEKNWYIELSQNLKTSLKTPLLRE